MQQFRNYFDHALWHKGVSRPPGRHRICLTLPSRLSIVEERLLKGRKVFKILGTELTIVILMYICLLYIYTFSHTIEHMDAIQTETSDERKFSKL